MLTYLPAAKMAAKFVTSLGVSKIVAGIVKNNVPVSTTYEKVVVGVGSFVIGSMIVEQSSNHIERVVDEFSKPLLEKMSENKEEAEEKAEE